MSLYLVAVKAFASPNKKGRQVVIPGGLYRRVWWSWGDLNPRPQAFFGQIYMFSGLI